MRSSSPILHAVLLRRALGLAAAWSLAVAPVAIAQAGLLSPIRNVAMSATKPSVLTVLVASGSAQTLAGITDNAVNLFPSPVSITTAWDLRPGTAAVRLIAWFGTPAQALANGTNYIAASRIRGRVRTTPVLAQQPTAWTSFTQNTSSGVGINGGTLRLFRIPITAANRRSSRTQNLELQLDLTGQPATTAGTYSGTLNLRAVTQ